MAYLYEQQPMPTNATGVPLTLTVYDSNGNVVATLSRANRHNRTLHGLMDAAKAQECTRLLPHSMAQTRISYQLQKQA